MCYIKKTLFMSYLSFTRTNFMRANQILGDDINFMRTNHILAVTMWWKRGSNLEMIETEEIL